MVLSGPRTRRRSQSACAAARLAAGAGFAAGRRASCLFYSIDRTGVKNDIRSDLLSTSERVSMPVGAMHHLKTLPLLASDLHTLAYQIGHRPSRGTRRSNPCPAAHDNFRVIRQRFLQIGDGREINDDGPSEAQLRIRSYRRFPMSEV